MSTCRFLPAFDIVANSKSQMKARERRIERESTIMLLFLKDPYLFRFQIPFSHADVCEEFKVQLNILFSDSVQSKFQMTTYTSTYLLVFPPRKMCFVLLGDKLTRRKPSIN